MRGDVGRVPIAQRTTGKGLAAHFLHHQAAWTVAAGAVRQPFHQVGTPIPLGTLRRIRFEGGLVEEQQIPRRHGRAHAEGEWQFGGTCLLIDRGDRLHEVDVQRVDVLVGQLGVRGVRHRRIQTGTILAHALADRLGEVGLRVVANAVGRGRGDVARPDLTQRRGDRVAAGVGLALLRAGVARHAVRGHGQVAPTFDGVVGARGVADAGQQAQCDEQEGLHAARSMASAARRASAAMVKVLLTTLAETIALPPGSHRFG